MRCLGIDYGEKRIGLSYGDDLGLAVPISAAVELTLDARLAHIGNEIRERRIEQLVVGYPYNMDGSVGFKAKEVDAFIDLLDKTFALPIEKVDERLTSEVAIKTLGWKAKEERDRRKGGALDSTAAMIILQDFLDTRFPHAIMDPFDEEGI